MPDRSYVGEVAAPQAEVHIGRVTHSIASAAVPFVESTSWWHGFGTLDANVVAVASPYFATAEFNTRDYRVVVAGGYVTVFWTVTEFTAGGPYNITWNIIAVRDRVI